jgi:hypothetical protein
MPISDLVEEASLFVALALATNNHRPRAEPAKPAAAISHQPVGARAPST